MAALQVSFYYIKTLNSTNSYGLCTEYLLIYFVESVSLSNVGTNIYLITLLMTKYLMFIEVGRIIEWQVGNAVKLAQKQDYRISF